MASVKVTVTLPEEQVQRIRELVSRGDDHATVSGFVQRAVQNALDDVAGWQRTLDEALEASGGPLTEEERRWADAILDGINRSVA